MEPTVTSDTDSVDTVTRLADMEPVVMPSAVLASAVGTAPEQDTLVRRVTLEHRVTPEQRVMEHRDTLEQQDIRVLPAQKVPVPPRATYRSKAAPDKQ
jgi:hypothetical protein